MYVFPFVRSYVRRAKKRKEIEQKVIVEGKQMPFYVKEVDTIIRSKGCHFEKNNILMSLSTLE